MIAPNTTPGPWVAVDGMIGPRLSNDSGIQIKVARVAGYTEAAPLDVMIDAQANAHLIAAAPELYKALERMLAMHGSDAAEEAAHGAIAALRKARGETA